MRIAASLLVVLPLVCLAEGEKPPDPRQWLAARQTASGGFVLPGESEARAGPTALALLPYLTAGSTPHAPTADNPYGDVLRRGLDFLAGVQGEDGRYSTDDTAHALATLVACEAWGTARRPADEAAAKRGLAALRIRADSALETCVWTAMAVKSARTSGLPVDEGMIGLLRMRLHPGPAAARRQLAEPRPAALSALLRVMLGDDPAKSPAIRSAADTLARHVPARAEGSIDEPYWYFGTLVMFHVGGEPWKKWRLGLDGAVVGTLAPDGSWDPSPDCPYGRLGATALLTLSLQVHARYEQVFGAPAAPEVDAEEVEVTEAIGLGGGAGGSMRGRGGRRNLRARGGGGTRAPSFHTESYDRIGTDGFSNVWDVDVSTLSIDVDTAAYANVRRFLMQEGKRPPKDAVRIEELINYFDYGYTGPDARSPHPFSANLETGACPWAPEHRIVRVGLQARRVDLRDRPGANLVFLLDVSGSMRPGNKLPLVKRAMRLLTERLDARDTVSIAVYAGAAGLVLPPTAGDDHAAILGALERLGAGGSTNGGQGIALAYAQARASYKDGGINRVILCTDGDFNVGVTDRGSLTRLVEEQAKAGVELTIAGFGRGNLKDATMEELTNKGNGNYAYVDTIAEARKVFVEQLAGTLLTVAKDVKIQVFFNPRRVSAWRLIGYENRRLKKEDFNDDTKDAGEIGAGHSVTALYEIVPAGGDAPAPKADDNPFLERARTTAEAGSGALLRLRLRYKAPGSDTSTLLESDVFDPGGGFDEASEAFRWAATVAQFGMLLRDSEHKGGATWDGLLEIAASAVGDDAKGYRKEMLAMAAKARDLAAPRAESRN